ncbi:MAG: AAA family ATPase [Deltaproteobacteria bacterium]|nr:AAA family ATPase [Deltaproteobacteria bacterium]
MSSPCKILVTGDYGFDYNLYLDSTGSNQLSDSRPARLKVSLGGAGIIHSLLRAVAKKLAGSPDSLKVGLALNSAEKKIEAPPTAGLWEPQPLGKLAEGAGDEKVWRLKQSLSLRGAVGLLGNTGGILPKGASDDFAPDILVVEDDAAGFRLDTPRWHPALSAPTNPRQWTILKMTAPLCQGDLWRHLTSENNIADRLVVVLSVDHIRREDVRISKGISWERTVVDLVRKLTGSPALPGLMRAKHVIVTLDGDGALWMCRSDQNELSFRLFFDRQHLEEEWTEQADIRGNAYGLMSCFTAALAACLAVSPERQTPQSIGFGLTSGIVLGLQLMRFLKVVGHGRRDGEKPTFLFKDMAEAIVFDPSHQPSRKRPSGRIETKLALACRELWQFAQTDIPYNELESEQTLPHWHILAGNQPGSESQENEPLYGIAKRVAIFGPEARIEAPMARFGELRTLDRNEIEALNNIKFLIKAYRHPNDEHKPLSLAVFGPPGAGKSFGIKQIALEVLGKKTPFLEFNLSQFKDVDDLIGAFHQVRDKVLEGHLPVIFWDEFDSQNYRWLQYLLAPMQDGRFQEGQITHPIGKCIFVFAGATSYTMEDFGPAKPREQDAAGVEAWDKFKLCKGPDFKSRLHGYINVLGPNRRQKFNPSKAGDTWEDDSSDICFPVRRALLLRSILKAADNRLQIDRGLLSALLEVKCYTHGARSFEKIVRHLRSDLPGAIHRSSLPPDEVMAMNVDIEEFSSKLIRSEDFQKLAEKLAPRIHDSYSGHTQADEPGSPYNGTPYDDLPQHIKADNVAAAHRIPWILELAGLFLVPEGQGSETTDDDVSRVLESLIDLLAEEEHDLWMEHKQLQGWRYGKKRNNAEKIHNCLVPYRNLEEPDREKDRDQVRAFPKIAEKAGFKISRRQPAKPKKQSYAGHRPNESSKSWGRVPRKGKG